MSFKTNKTLSYFYLIATHLPTQQQSSFFFLFSFSAFALALCPELIITLPYFLD